jgi:hypothetical protein
MGPDLRLELQQRPPNRKERRAARLQELARALREAAHLKVKFTRERAFANAQARAADRAWRAGLEEARKLAGPGFEQWIQLNQLQEHRSGSNNETQDPPGSEGRA